MFKLVSFLALAATAIAAPLEIALDNADPVKLTDCSTPASHAKLANLVMEPNPPKKGTTNKVTATGTLDKTITGGKYVLKVTAFGMNLDHEGPVCGSDTWKLPLNMGEIRMNALTCPDDSDFKIAADIEVSKLAPSGKVVAEITAVDQDNQELTCFRAELEI